MVIQADKFRFADATFTFSQDCVHYNSIYIYLVTYLIVFDKTHLYGITHDHNRIASDSECQRWIKLRGFI